MNRTDRLLGLVLELQSRSWARAEDLARSFEVSRRTVYRDILALNEAGVPVISVPGRGYALMDGYFLPPLHFSAEEGFVLLLGSDIAARSFAGVYGDAARSAGRKIEAVLSGEARENAAYLRDNLRLISLEDPRLQALQRPLLTALLERRVVRFGYRAPGRDPQVREVHPHGLFRLGGVWMLAAFDPCREALRNFRLDRIDGLELGERHFARQPDFRLERRPDLEERHLRVRVRLDPSAAAVAAERRCYYTVLEEPDEQGLTVTLRCRRLEEVLPWVLSWGGALQPLEPPELRERLRLEAQRTLERC
ncbi:putative DNA-binding transcriptional regulator YafY [Deinobacterium chartae]|uniref:Putative DNA-binding transcriptional regulator YafY n=1 Tax=Deinobacterium chartae TaxID=521158 RepID=A0A841I6W6_9DEIO|nr:YafY family protein [Deinobacterium chartae]MBB6099632.1 putative DNA-binding transcriptional regulator YafY [Deinobacterium chartae]